MLPRGAHHDIDDASSTDGSSGFDKGLLNLWRVWEEGLLLLL